MNDYVTWFLLALIVFGNSRYGTRTANYFDALGNRIKKGINKVLR